MNVLLLFAVLSLVSHSSGLHWGGWSGSSESGSSGSHSESSEGSSGSDSSSSGSGSSSSSSGSSSAGCVAAGAQDAVVRDTWRPAGENSLEATPVAEGMLGWLLDDISVTLHNFPAVLQRQGVRAYFPKQMDPIPSGSVIRVECPSNCEGAPCEVVVTTYHCPPCSSQTNGRLPGILPVSGWAPGHCSPRFANVAAKYGMVGFRKLVPAGASEDLPATELPLSNVAVFVRPGATDCTELSQSQCSANNECKWESGECVSDWCVPAPVGVAPSCLPCAPTV